MREGGRFFYERFSDGWFSGRLSDETGSASLEFITAGLILLVPLVYLVIAVSTLQGASLAVEGAARQAARVFVQQESAAAAQAAADTAVDFALADYGIDADGAAIDIACAPDPSRCLTRDGRVTVTVSIVVPLPLVPDVIGLRGDASVPFSASATQTVSRFWTGEP
jgi:Flp pilus assembly protein TadG